MHTIARETASVPVSFLWDAVFRLGILSPSWFPWKPSPLVTPDRV